MHVLFLEPFIGPSIVSSVSQLLSLNCTGLWTIMMKHMDESYTESSVLIDFNLSCKRNPSDLYQRSHTPNTQYSPECERVLHVYNIMITIIFTCLRHSVS